MKRPLVILALGTLVAAAPHAWADEPPHLEFARGLREKHYTDLALEYLEKLAKKPPSPEVECLLPLELAKTRLDLAKAESENSKRLALYHQARQELDAFLKNNPQHPRVAEAQLELVNVTVLQGKTQLTKALRLKSAAAREAEALKARPLLQEAGQRLAAAAAKVKEQFDNFKDPKTPQEKADKKALEQAWLQAEYERGLNLWDQLLTFIDTGNEKVFKERRGVLDEATKTFEKVSKYSDTIPLCWQAHAWYGRCQVERGDPKRGRKAFNEVLAATGRNFEGAHALARYFLILAQLERPEMDDPPLLKACENWLANSPSHRNAPEANHVRYLLANELMQAADKTKDQVQRRSYLNRARTLFRQLEQTDNDYADEARVGKIKAIEQLGGLNATVNTLKTFDDCYVRAQYEAHLLGTNPKKLVGDEWEKQRKAHLQTMEQALNQALKLADKKIPESEVIGARSLLAYVYLAHEDYKQAVEIAEKIARTKPQPSQAAAAATHALRAYQQMLNDPKKAGLADDKAIENYRERLRQFAVYMENTWPEEPVGDLGRHQQGLLSIQDKDLAKAVEVLERIRPGYPSAIFTKYQLALAAFQAEKDKVELPKNEKRSWQARALAALESMPELPADADSEMTRLYLLARLDLGREYYRLKKFDQMRGLAQPLLATLGGMSLPGEQRDEFRSGLESLILYAEYGRAEAEFSAGKLEQAAKLLDGVLAKVEKGEFTELKKNAQLRWGLLGLALRVNVQLGKNDQAKAILELLRKFAKDDSSENATAAILLPMVQLLKEQIQELRKQGDKAKPQLAKTMESFELFLDETDKRDKAKTLEVSLFLAQGFASLENHDRAAKLLADIPEPKDGDPKKMAYYQAIRVLYLRQLRLAKDLKKAREVAQEMIGSKEKPGWGASNLDALKENNFLYEDEGNYRAAVLSWDTMLKSLRGKIDQSGVKEQYLEIYFYLTQTYFRYAITTFANDTARRQKEIDKAASFITKLEGSFPDLGGEVSKARFHELLDKEPLLKEAYDKQKK
jgi:hypothetical protein